MEMSQFFLLPKSDFFPKKKFKKSDSPFPFLFLTFVQNFTQKHIAHGGMIPHWKISLGLNWLDLTLELWQYQAHNSGRIYTNLCVAKHPDLISFNFVISKVWQIFANFEKQN